MGLWMPTGGVRSRVRAAWKALEGDDRQTHKSIGIIERYSILYCTSRGQDITQVFY